MVDNVRNEDAGAKRAGIIYGLGAFALWGVLPLYWKLLKQVPAQQILAHRVFWSFIFVSGILVMKGRFNKVIDLMRNRKSLCFVCVCSLMISINWFVYIWAVNSNHIVEASMGYYINPLMSVVLGMAVLKEKLDFSRYIALALAAIGVVIITIHYGRVPWIALILAVSFALYGLFKKLTKADSLTGLALETAILVPVAFIYIIFKQVQGTGALGSIPIPAVILLLCAGAATATPLLWFAEGAKRVELSTIGFLQYVSPTLSLFIGILIFKEKFSTGHIISFSFIWAGLIMYSLSQTSFLKNVSPAFERLTGLYNDRKIS